MKTGARNWKDYNKALVNRGSITLWIDKKSICSWYSEEPAVKRGRPCYYSDVAIECMLTVKYVYRLSLRSTQGFMQSILKWMNVSLEAVSYSQLCRRQKHLPKPKLRTLSGAIHLVVDGSGLKVYGEGEWKVRQHGYSKRRDWMKLHLCVDEHSQFIVSAQLTDSHCSEHKQLDKLLSGYAGQIQQVSADAGYDYHESYDVIQRYGATPVIAPNINPQHRKKQLAQLRKDKPRDSVRWLQEQLGVEAWKTLNNYHRRSLVETAFYRFKQLFGATLMARTTANQRTEALLKCSIMNFMTQLGIPATL
jgi:transposase